MRLSRTILTLLWHVRLQLGIVGWGCFSNNAVTPGKCHYGWQPRGGLAPLQLWHIGAHDPSPRDAKLDTIGTLPILLGLVVVVFCVGVEWAWKFTVGYTIV